MYASLGTRPDIIYAMQTVSRFSSSASEALGGCQVIRYPKGTKELWLSYGGQQQELAGYADADGSMAEDRHATSGYAFLLHGGTGSWTAKRLEIISSFHHRIRLHRDHPRSQGRPLAALSPSRSIPFHSRHHHLVFRQPPAIALTKDHQYHTRTKHIDIRFHFIRWIVENGSLRLVCCPTDEMVADTLTKALPSHKVKHFAAELGLVSV